MSQILNHLDLRGVEVQILNYLDFREVEVEDEHT